MSPEHQGTGSQGIDWNEEFSRTGYAERFIRKFTRGLHRRGLIGPNDRDDLMQELRLALFQAWPAFDPTRGRWKGFVSRVVTRTYLRRMRESHRKQDRFERELASFSDVGLSPSMERDLDEAPSVSEDAASRRSGCESADETTDAIERDHLRSATSRLAEDLRALAADLKARPAVQVAKERGWTRRQMDAAIRRLRDELSRILDD